MVRDTQQKLSKKDTKKDKKSVIATKKKCNHNSDSDDDESSSDNDEMDIHEYQKFLYKTFPSKYLAKKIKSGENLKETIKEDLQDIQKGTSKLKKKSKRDESSDEEEEWETESEEEKESKKKKKNDKNKNKNKKVVQSETEEEDDEYETDDDEDYYTVDDEDEKMETHKNGKSNKLNIIFTIGGVDKNEDYYDDDEDYSDDSDYYTEDDETEDEDVSVSSSSDEDAEEVKKSSKKTQRANDIEKVEKVEKVEKAEKNSKSGKEQKKEDLTNKKKESNDNGNVLNKLKELLEENKENDTIKKCIEVYEDDIEKNKEKNAKKHQKTKDKHLRIFKKIVKDKNVMNDFTFYEKLEISDQKKIIKELREINKITRIEKPYRITLLESDIPTLFKGAAMKKINSLRYMEPGSGEFYKIKNWVDTFMRIPFGKYQTLPINIDDGVNKCHDFMENAQNTLNTAVYGLNDAKMQIMQMLGQLVTNPKSIGTAIAIHGPPGTGKTSLVKEGISKILNRPFAFIALGGATDSSFLEGHSYTYEGSTWGKIVQILIDSKCMNPVIYFDELDKISDTPRGEEIAGILTHLTDTSQNSQFHDKYFAEINFDLSKCLFIFSYNDESKVNPILKDRMYRIQTKGYNQKQKTVIGYDYLLPRIREQVKFDDKDIIIPDETIHYIIDAYCNKEDGVRNLKRCLEIIHTKLNLYRLMKPDSNLFEEDMSLKVVSFPFTVSKDCVDKLIKKDKDSISTMYSMYV